MRDFLTRINAPELAAAKQQVKGTPALLNSFQDAANFIALSVILIKVNTRNIGGLSQKPQPFPQPDGHIGTNIKTDTQSIISTITPFTNFTGRGQRG